MKDKVLQQSHPQTQHNRGNKISDLEDRLAEMTQIETQRNKEGGKNRAPKSYETESNWPTIELSSTPGLGRSPREGNGYPLQYSGLENSMDSIVLGIAEPDTTERLSLSLSCVIGIPEREEIDTDTKQMSEEIMPKIFTKIMKYTDPKCSENSKQYKHQTKTIKHI